jgi:hypothetical protein
MRFWLKGIIVACALGFAGTCALVQASAPDFYRGKTVRIFIGFGPGGLLQSLRGSWALSLISEDAPSERVGQGCL